MRLGWTGPDPVALLFTTMAAPEYVPTFSTHPKFYSAPTRRREAWIADRPGETVGYGQPTGSTMGYPGPGQGFAIKLARTFHDQVFLNDGEDFADVEQGALAVALRRASLFSRAPVIHDVRLALTIFGYLDRDAPDDLVQTRKDLFDELANPHHYSEVRQLADLVPEATLRMTPAKAEVAYRADWRGASGLSPT